MKNRIIFYPLFILFVAHFFLIGRSYDKVVLKQVLKICGYKNKINIPIIYLEYNSFRDKLNKYLEDKFTLENISPTWNFLHLSDLMTGSSPAKFRNFLISFNGKNAISFYNEKEKKIYMSLENRHRDQSSISLARNIRSFIQSQLMLKKDYWELYDDRTLAREATLKGDEVLLMLQYANKHTMFPLDHDLAALSTDSESLFVHLPSGSINSYLSYSGFFVKPKIFTYIGGYKFAYSINNKDNWRGNKKVLKKMPKSTKEILHPKIYLKGFTPLDVTINYKIKNSFNLIYEGVIGEYQSSLFVGENLYRQMMKDSWQGDIVKIYKSLEEKKVYLWKSVWKNSKYAEIYFSLFKDFIESKKNLNFIKINKEKGNSALAARGKSYYYFININQKTIFYVKSNCRKTINEFISGGNYD